MAPANILIVDDHELIRAGVRGLFASDPQVTVSGEAKDGKEAIEQVRKLNPDLVILDITMPVMNGLDAATEIRRLAPKTKIVILTMHDAAQMRDQAQRAGADAFVVKSDVAAKLANIVRFLLEIQTETV
jgi:DNA-binding NarL/FixJ family response regulator